MRAPVSTFTRAKQLRRAMSLPEVLLWRDLRRGALAKMRFRRLHWIGPFVLDFYCPAANLCVEIDGAAHDTRASLDAARDRRLREAGIATLRFNAREVARRSAAAGRAGDNRGGDGD